MSNDSTVAVVTESKREWGGLIISSQVINGVLFSVTVWVLTCTIAYGFKTNRWWNRPGTSSLSTGTLYTTCTIAIALKLPNYILTQVWLYMAINTTSNLGCEVIVDSSVTGSVISLYVVYLFLWLLQRRTLTHPYIKARVNKHVDYFSRGTIVAITLVFFGLILLFLVDENDFIKTANGCAPNPESLDKLKVSVLLFSLCLVLIQLILLVMSMYSASRAIIPRASGNDQRCDGADETLELEEESELESYNCYQIFMKNVIQNATLHHPTGPIHMAVKRTAISSIIIFGSDLLLNLISVLAFPPDAFLFLRYSIGYIQSCVHVFAMLATFGFTGEVLTLCCPKSVTRVALKRTRPRASAVAMTPLT